MPIRLSKKTLILAAAAAGFALLVGAYLARTPKRASAVTVTSDDGMASVAFDPAALPAGVTPEDIKVVKTDAAETFGKEGLSGGLIAYRFEPEGTVFSSSATVSISYVPAEDATPEDGLVLVPLLFHVSDGVVEPVENTAFGIDVETGRRTLSGEAGSFSAFVLDPNVGVFTASINADKVDFDIGEKVKATVKVSHRWSQIPPQYAYSVPEYDVAPETTWSVNDDLKEHFMAVRYGSTALVPRLQKTGKAVAISGKDYATTLPPLTFTCVERSRVGLVTDLVVRAELAIKDHPVQGPPKIRQETRKIQTHIFDVESDLLGCWTPGEAVYGCAKAPYLLDCPGATFVSGSYRTNSYDCEPFLNEKGEKVDDVTGLPPVCP